MPRPILHVIGPSIAYVILTDWKFSVIEADDAELVGHHSWGYRVENNGRKISVTAHVSLPSGKRRTLSLHRWIMGPENPLSVDHVNGNVLDNRRHNLRFATARQQTWNRKGMCSDKPKGVSACGKKWRVRIRLEGKKVHIGVADTKEAAGELYRQAALRHFGEFARF